MNRTQEAWGKLSLYLSRDVLARRYEARHSTELQADKANEIIAHLSQAQQYFRSAETAGILAGPLEQYYGILSFARAITLYLWRDAREATLQKSHGLRARPTTDSGPVNDVTLVITQGTFDEFLDATGNTGTVALSQFSVTDSLIIPASSRVVRSLYRPKRGVTFTLVDLLSRRPGLRGHYEEAFDGIARCHRGSLQNFMSEACVYILQDRFVLPPIEVFQRDLNLSTWAGGRSRVVDGYEFRRSLLGERYVDIAPNIVEYGNYQYIVEAYSGGWELSEIASYFAASHGTQHAGPLLSDTLDAPA